MLLSAEHVEVADGAVVDVSTAGQGSGGALRIEAGSVRVAGRGATGQTARLGAQADAAGSAGGIEIEARSVVVIGEGGEVTALSEGNGGNPGNIAVRAGDIVVRGDLSSESAGGSGGNIELEASGQVVLRGSQVSVRSADDGNAGNIAITGDRVRLHQATLSADARGFGGEVEISGARLVALFDTNVEVVSQGGANDAGLAGGNVRIGDAPVVLSNSTLTANGFGNADGGNISITADPLLVSADSALTASSELGVDGEIVLDSPNTEITGELAALSDAFLDASSLLVESCLARDEVAGTFAVRTLRQTGPSADSLWPPADGPACEAP